jgi:predicted acylesterase/phospholipase RssA
MWQAVLASAAISALVLPIQVGDRVGTDGGWVRNYPLGYAYDRPEVELIVGFRYVPRYPVLSAAPLRTALTRLRRYSKLPPARALIDELEEAVEREERGLPAHIADIFSRLGRVSVIRNTELEESRCRLARPVGQRVAGPPARRARARRREPGARRTGGSAVRRGEVSRSATTA